MLVVLASSGNEIASRGYGAYLLTSLLVLVAVCALAWFVIRFGARRFSLGVRDRPGGAIKVLARVSLDPRLSLYLVEAGGKALLLGTGERGLDVLAELDRDVVAAELEPPARPRRAGFAELVETFRRARGGLRHQPESGADTSEGCAGNSSADDHDGRAEAAPVEPRRG